MIAKRDKIGRILRKYEQFLLNCTTRRDHTVLSSPSDDPKPSPVPLQKTCRQKPYISIRNYKKKKTHNRPSNRAKIPAVPKRLIRNRAQGDCARRDPSWNFSSSRTRDHMSARLARCIVNPIGPRPRRLTANWIKNVGRTPRHRFCSSRAAAICF